VSLIVNDVVVATTVPLVLPVLIDNVNVSAPSVVKSAVGIMLNDPELFAIANDPVFAVKSPAFEFIVQ